MIASNLKTYIYFLKYALRIRELEKNRLYFFFWAQLGWKRIFFADVSFSEVAWHCSWLKALSSKDGLSTETEQTNVKTIHDTGIISLG